MHDAPARLADSNKHLFMLFEFAWLYMLMQCVRRSLSASSRNSRLTFHSQVEIEGTEALPISP